MTFISQIGNIAVHRIDVAPDVFYLNVGNDPAEL